MFKILISGAIAILGIISANTAVAQSYAYPITSGTGCVTIAKDLSLGSRGPDVTALQNFMLAQNYPGSGAWMVTGYFGAATRQAVLNFQSQRALAGTGIADAQTRLAIAASTCGANYVLPPFANPVSQSYSYPNSLNVSISSLSVASGPIGTSVTVYGSGFDPVYNNVYFGNSPISGNIASNGTSLTFTVPSSVTSNCVGYGCNPYNRYTNPGVYQIYVTNTRGTSNSLTFTVTSGGHAACPWYVNFGNCAGGYGQYWNANINSLYPTSGGVGTNVTVFGSGFSQRGNSIRFGAGVITNLTSSDGTSLSFTVPTQLTGYGSQSMAVGTYNVSVTNDRGSTSNALPFTVTSIEQNALPPAITSVNGPVRITAGTQGVWTVTLSSYGSSNVTTSVRWGDESVNPYSAVSSQVLSPGTQTLTFTHTYQTSGAYMAVFTVTNSSGQQNTATATVTVTPYSSDQLTLSNAVPSFGRAGTLVALTGTGFTLSGNTVHFGSGGTANLTSSNNGTTLYYTIPAYVSPCDVIGQGYACAQYVQQVTPGTYPIYVSNAAGQTSTIYFTVTQ